jgi:hypothetical protein
MKNSLPARSATDAKKRRRRYGLQALFETTACDVQGTRVRGRCYRQGREKSGDARDYQFAVTPVTEPPAEQADEVRSLLARFYARVIEVCNQYRTRRERTRALDVMCCRFSAGWPQADLAAHWGCHRVTVYRCERKLLRKLRTDPTLLGLYRQLRPQLRPRRMQRRPPYMEGATE